MDSDENILHDILKLNETNLKMYTVSKLVNKPTNNNTSFIGTINI